MSILEGMANVAGSAVKVHYAGGLPSLDEMVYRTEFSTAAEGGTRGLRAEYFATEKLTGEPVLALLHGHATGHL